MRCRLWLYRCDQRPHLLSRREVNARGGHNLVPSHQELILRGQAVESAPFNRVVLRILHPAPTLPLCRGIARWVGKITVP
jgi:hypothetical protein